MSGFSGPPAAFGWRNRLFNGTFFINQRLTTAPADDTYVHDRWYVLTQSAAITVGGLSSPENGQVSCIRLTQSNAAAQRMGVAQIIESSHCVDLRQAPCSMSGRIRCSSAQPIRWAALEWIGTGDAVVSDVVNDWTSTNYTAGNFFVASVAVVASGVMTPGAAIWTSLPATVGAPSASMANLVVFVWTDAVAAQNVTLDIGLMQLEDGVAATPFERRPPGAELMLCQRFFEKSFLQQIAPAGNAGLQTGEERWQSPTAGATLQEVTVNFQVHKKYTPAMTWYNPSAANQQMRDATASADCTSTSTNFSTNRGALVTAISPAGTAVGGQMAVHWTASAEL